MLVGEELAHHVDERPVARDEPALLAVGREEHVVGPELERQPDGDRLLPRAAHVERRLALALRPLHAVVVGPGLHHRPQPLAQRVSLDVGRPRTHRPALVVQDADQRVRQVSDLGRRITSSSGRRTDAGGREVERRRSPARRPGGRSARERRSGVVRVRTCRSHPCTTARRTQSQRLDERSERSGREGYRGTGMTISFATRPQSYRHWRLAIDGPVATLVLAVTPDAGLRDDYELKLNSYDLGVDIELARRRAAAALRAPRGEGGRRHRRARQGVLRRRQHPDARRVDATATRSTSASSRTRPRNAHRGRHRAVGSDVDRGRQRHRGRRRLRAGPGLRRDPARRRPGVGGVAARGAAARRAARAPAG